MNEQIQLLITKLGLLRNGVPQLVYFSAIFHREVVTLREIIKKYRLENPSVEEIDFILFSPGGGADDSYRIIRTLRKNFKTVNVIVPFWAKSAATLLSLGATNIIMDEYGEFGPLDAQLAKKRNDSPEIERESALNDESSIAVIESRFKVLFEQMYIRLYENRQIDIDKDTLSKQLLNGLPGLYNPLMSQVDPYKLGEKKRTLDVGNQYAARILLQFGKAKDPMKARKLVQFLINDCPDHGYIIDYDLMKKFVDNVHTSDYFGTEYKMILEELSLALMMSIEEEFEPFIGFISGIILEKSEEMSEVKTDFDENGPLVIGAQGEISHENN